MWQWIFPSLRGLSPAVTINDCISIKNYFFDRSKRLNPQNAPADINHFKEAPVEDFFDLSHSWFSAKTY